MGTRSLLVLDEDTWTERARLHRERITRWTGPHRRRQQRGEKHPVLDFLFTYYPHKPARLERWHPGIGVALGGPTARERLRWVNYVDSPQGVTLDPAALGPKRLRTAEFVRSLLEATDSRPAQLGCFGLHEWAMVYQLAPADLRHAEWPLRLGHRGTDEVVESMRVRCTHHDAFRFFTEPARPRNELQPRREDQVALEQPGCLHAGMDLYKWAYKLDPLLPSELVADCFELAARIRELDMRASPYDLSALGYTPVPIETPQGRAEYARAQRDFADEAGHLRRRLIACCRDLLDRGSERDNHDADAAATPQTTQT